MEAEVADLKVEVAVKDAKIQEQAEEIAWLKGLPPRPKFKGKPSGMEAATSKPLGRKEDGTQAGSRLQAGQAGRDSENQAQGVGCPAGFSLQGL
jgi:hypothetical protein